MQLTPETINAYKTILTDPASYKMDFKPIAECFIHSDITTPKHILFEQYASYINKPLPKLIFYIIMDEMYKDVVGKAPDGCLGFFLKLNP
jgi:hypothetical protein